MVKPIGNLAINLRREDKMSYRLKAKFGSPSPLLQNSASKPSATNSSKKVVKYKTRKK